MVPWFTAVTAVALSTVAAPEAAAKGNRYLKKAKKAYDNLDYTRVTPLLNRALKTSKTDAEKVEVYFLLGTMHAIYSRDQLAAEAFAEVLELDPSFELPPDTSPKIRSAFADARASVNGRAVGGGGGPDEETRAAVDDELPQELFGATDGGMPGLAQRSRAPWYTKWWIWTLVGVAVAGGTGYLVYSLNRDDTPDHDFGPIPLR